MTVRELLTRIDAHELAEWQAFYSLYPFGDERADMRQAMTSLVMANAWRGKNDPPFKLQNFLPFSSPLREQKQTMDQMMATARNISQSLGKYGHR